MKYIIDRSKWVCGGEYERMGSTQMLDKIDRMCCLGHISSIGGVEDKYMLEKTSPAEVAHYQALDNNGSTCVPDWLIDEMHNNTAITSEMIGVNDDIGCSQESREASLRKLAVSAGHELEFINELLPKEKS